MMSRPCNNTGRLKALLARSWQLTPTVDAPNWWLTCQAAAGTDAEGSGGSGAAPAKLPKRGSGGGRRAAISRTGHTNRGRVRQKSHKAAELLETGELRCAPRPGAWHGRCVPQQQRCCGMDRRTCKDPYPTTHACLISGTVAWRPPWSLWTA